MAGPVAAPLSAGEASSAPGASAAAGPEVQRTDRTRPAGPDVPGDPRSAEAQDEPPPELVIARIRSSLEAIAQEEAANGADSAGLIPLLESLARVYQDTGDYEDANLALERARHLVRTQAGLYSLDQAGIVEKMIDNDIDATPGEQFAELESLLSELVRRNPNDPRVVEVLTSKAERDMDIARYLLTNGVEPEFTVTVGYARPAWNRDRQSPTARSMARSMIASARSSYSWAMASALRGDSLDIPRLLELEDDIIQTYYFEVMNAGLRHRRQTYAQDGRLRFAGANALTVKLANSRTYPGTPMAVTNALLELADWQLMFHSFGHAMQRYEAAREYLAQQAGDEVVAQVFSPESPVPLPAFAPNASVYVDDGNVHGYIDVSIEINRYGGVRDLELLGRSPNASGAVARRLTRHIYQSRFRPRFVDGAWLRSDRFALRYHFSYVSP